MRRRPPSADDFDRSGVSVEKLRPQPADDLSLPYPKRIEISEKWLAERAEWVERRDAFTEKYGWPGGDFARFEEEHSAHPIGDQPFDPVWEIKMGRL